MRRIDLLLLTAGQTQGLTKLLTHEHIRPYIVNDVEYAVELMQRINFDIVAIDEGVDPEAALRLSALTRLSLPEVTAQKVDSSRPTELRQSLVALAGEIGQSDGWGEREYKLQDNTFDIPVIGACPMSEPTKGAQ